MKRTLCHLGLSVGLTLSAAQGATITESFTFGGLGIAVADGNPSGAANLQTITSNVTSIESMRVSLQISGTWNGDLYAYLSNGAGLAVLLNRAGRTAANQFGYGDDGFDVTFDDSAANNIHTYQNQVTPTAGNALGGDWQPDGRLIDPGSVVDTDPVTAQLAVFNTQAASGDWTLFVADLAGGDAHTIESWSMEITGVPEPGTVSLLVLGAAGLFLRRRR